MTTRDRKSNTKTSRGVPWSDVLVSDLLGMARDGLEAAALLKVIEEKSRNDDAGETEF
jgi:hypothetical protein